MPAVDPTVIMASTLPESTERPSQYMKSADRPSPLRRLAFALATIAAIAPLGTGVARAAAPKENAVDFSGQKIVVWEKRPTAPKAAILLVHGRTWSSLPDFDLQLPGENLSLMDALVARGYAVYALDLPGYGKSPRLKDGWLSPDEAAEALAAAMRWVAKNSGLQTKPALFGWSNGSRTSHLMAQRHPELLSDLILFGYPVDPNKKAFPTNDPAEPPRTPTTEQDARSDFITPGSISPAAVNAYVAVALVADPIRTDWRHLEQWNELDPAKLTVPVLLIQGQFDPNTPSNVQAQSFVRFGNPDRQWVILAGGDHAALLEKMQPAFIAAIISFLERPRGN